MTMWGVAVPASVRGPWARLVFVILLVASFSSSLVTTPLKPVTLQTAIESLSQWSTTANMNCGMTVDHIIDSTAKDGIKAGQYLADRWYGTKSRAAKECKKGHVLLNNAKIFGTRLVYTGDTLTVTLPETSGINVSDTKLIQRLTSFTSHLLREENNPPIHILYEDDYMAVVYKPAGIHSLKWKGTMTKNTFAFDDVLPFILSPPSSKAIPSNICEDEVSDTTEAYDVRDGAQDALARPLPCHRIDARVCGCLVVAKTKNAHRAISQQFATKEVKKEYRAILVGDPIEQISKIVSSSDYSHSVMDMASAEKNLEEDGDGTVEATNWNIPPSLSVIQLSPDDDTIGDDGNVISRYLISSPIQGRQALTVMRVLEVTPDIIHGSLTTVSLSPLTGRRHQLRRHCALVGCPIVGDDLYHDIGAIRTIDNRLKNLAQMDAELAAAGKRSDDDDDDDDDDGDDCDSNSQNRHENDSETSDNKLPKENFDIAFQPHNYMEGDDERRTFPRVRKRAGLFLMSLRVSLPHPIIQDKTVVAACQEVRRFDMLRVKARRGFDWKVKKFGGVQEEKPSAE